MRRWQFAACSLFIGVSLAVFGCSSKKDEEFTQYTPGEQTESDHDHHHHHHAHGPNGGHLIELGDHEYHAEIVFDPQSRKLTVYLLGGDAKTAVPVEQEELTLDLKIGEEAVTVSLPAAPLEGEPEGQSSRFEIAGEDLPESIKEEDDLDGHLNVSIAGKEYKAKLEHDHGHHH
jgi:hypothetical protein